MNKEVIQAQQEQLRLQAILIAEQRIMISGQSAMINEKHIMISEQSTMINEQNTMIKLLEACVVVLENNQKKDSSNSSKPLSSNIGRAQRTQSLRTKSGKKAAGQPGHSGQTLTFSATPDQVVIHQVKRCSCCGKHLGDSVKAKYECRQVFDIPPNAMLVTEHRSEIKTCSH